MNLNNKILFLNLLYLLRILKEEGIIKRNGNYPLLKDKDSSKNGYHVRFSTLLTKCLKYFIPEKHLIWKKERNQFAYYGRLPTNKFPSYSEIPTQLKTICYNSFLRKTALPSNYEQQERDQNLPISFYRSGSEFHLLIKPYGTKTPVIKAFKMLKKFQEDWFFENQTKETNAKIVTKLLFNQIHRTKRQEIISFIEKNKKKSHQKLPSAKRVSGAIETAALEDQERENFVIPLPTQRPPVMPPRITLPDCPSPELLEYFRERGEMIAGLSSSQLYEYIRAINPEIVEESETRLTKREFLSYCE